MHAFISAFSWGYDVASCFSSCQFLFPICKLWKPHIVSQIYFPSLVLLFATMIYHSHRNESKQLLFIFKCLVMIKHQQTMFIYLSLKLWALQQTVCQPFFECQIIKRTSDHPKQGYVCVCVRAYLCVYVCMCIWIFLFYISNKLCDYFNSRYMWLFSKRIEHCC